MAFIDHLDKGITDLKTELNRLRQKQKLAKTDVAFSGYQQEIEETQDEIRRTEQYRRDYADSKKGLD